MLEFLGQAWLGLIILSRILLVLCRGRGSVCLVIAVYGPGFLADIEVGRSRRPTRFRSMADIDCLFNGLSIGVHLLNLLAIRPSYWVLFPKIPGNTLGGVKAMLVRCHSCYRLVRYHSGFVKIASLVELFLSIRSDYLLIPERFRFTFCWL